MTINSLINLN